MLRSMSTVTHSQDAASPPAGKLPRTLAIDIGGSRVKASVLDASGSMLADRVVIATPYPCPPDVLVSAIATLAGQLPAFERVSVGFPGVVRDGRVLSAPEFVSVGGLGTAVDRDLLQAWTNYDLTGDVSTAVGRPTRAANDADVQGLAVISGKGLELVITLGTSVGTGLFQDGRLAPHMEFAHHPFHDGETYYQQLGEAARKRIPATEWNRRVRRAVETLDALFFFDHVYIGGGNSVHVTADLGPKASIVDNTAGILGGIRLWEQGSTG
jgi:polyphosphate glucokinase